MFFNVVEVTNINIKMRNTILNVHFFELYNSTIKKQYRNLVKRYSTDTERYTLNRKKIIHPYRKLHPWKSFEIFSQHILDNVIYNKDGLVAINKPYGISARPQNINKDLSKYHSSIPGEVDYTLSETLPFVAKRLGYPELVIVKTPEKFMSGVMLLAADENIKNAINQAYVKSIGMNLLNKVYWIVTTRVPKQIEGKERLCMAKQFNFNKSESKVVIAENWSINSEKVGKVKVLKVEYNLISNSTNNLSSLIEIKSSTIKWHALRLFASTRLYTPILGDNIYATRIHKIGGSWLLTNPFAVSNRLPDIDAQLLELLYLTKAKTELIPCHIHARQVILPSFLGKESLTLEAPLIPPFDWTCKQLKFKNIPEFEENKEVMASSNA